MCQFASRIRSCARAMPPPPPPSGPPPSPPSSPAPLKAAATAPGFPRGGPPMPDRPPPELAAAAAPGPPKPAPPAPSHDSWSRAQGSTEAVVAPLAKRAHTRRVRQHMQEFGRWGPRIDLGEFSAGGSSDSEDNDSLDYRGKPFQRALLRRADALCQLPTWCEVSFHMTSDNDTLHGWLDVSFMGRLGVLQGLCRTQWHVTLFDVQVGDEATINFASLFRALANDILKHNSAKYPSNPEVNVIQSRWEKPHQSKRTGTTHVRLGHCQLALACDCIAEVVRIVLRTHLHLPYVCNAWSPLFHLQVHPTIEELAAAGLWNRN